MLPIRGELSHALKVWISYQLGKIRLFSALLTEIPTKETSCNLGSAALLRSGDA